MKPARGKFICLEGIDGAGKSYFSKKILEFLRAKGIDVVHTQEPGGTELANKLAQILLHFKEAEEKILPETELLMFFAARCQHLQNCILPSLDNGKWVISDRYLASSYAYQGHGRELGTAKVKALENYLPKPYQPDLILLFDISVADAKKRQSKDNRFEQMEDTAADQFLHKVVQGYDEYAANHPACHKINAALPKEDVWQEIKTYLNGYLK